MFSIRAEITRHSARLRGAGVMGIVNYVRFC